MGAPSEDDWIDPFDMENYDPSTQTMRKPPEEIIKPAEESILDPSKNSEGQRGNILENPVVLQLIVAVLVIILTFWLARRFFNRPVAPAPDPQEADGHDGPGGDAMEQRNQAVQPHQRQQEGPRGVGENEDDIQEARGRCQMQAEDQASVQTSVQETERNDRCRHEPTFE